MSRVLGKLAYGCVALGAIGYLDRLGAPATVQVFRWFFLVGFVLWLPVAGKVLVGWIRSRRRNTETDSRTSESSSTATEDPREWIRGGSDPGLLLYTQMFLMQFHPNTLFRSVLQLAGGLVAFLRHKGELPAPDTFQSETTYRPPFSGSWTVFNGSPDPEYSHSWNIVRQRYAYDFVITDEDGRTHDGTDVESFYCFDEPVRAPAAGTVVRTKDGHRDYHRTGRFDPFQYRLAGNYVLIKHTEDEYSFLAHLKNGSICVAEGEEVTQGQEIGRCGNSGNSTEPHIHFHVQDHAVPYVGAGLPIQFVGRTNDTDAADEGPIWVHCGQVLTAPE